jgi:hypothetical protein
VSSFTRKALFLQELHRLHRLHGQNHQVAGSEGMTQGTQGHGSSCTIPINFLKKLVQPVQPAHTSCFTAVNWCTGSPTSQREPVQTVESMM